MKVKDIIQELSKHEPEAMVVMNGYEGGCTEVGSIYATRIKTNVNKEWWYGSHEEDENGDTDAVYLG